MATDQPALPVNGNFVPGQQQPFEMSLQNNTAHSVNNSISTPVDYSSAQSQQQQSAVDVPKDEVGWYFVEQYYTTMSKNPEKLYLFYNKRSQFVSGSETERMDVCVGQKTIDERIKELDIQDCKVRVTNVDAQGSGQNIVIQVIGEMSTKKQPQRKFTQTFVLAEQVNGYFVLNDIFRYIVDDDEEIEGEELQRTQHEVATGYQEPTTTAVAGAEPHTLTNSQDPTARERDAQLVDQGLQEVAQNTITEPAPAGAVNGELVPAAEEVQSAEDAPAAAAAAAATAASPTTADDVPIQTTEETAQAIAHEDVKEPEKPAAPEPTPAASPPKQKPVQPAAAPAPAPAPQPAIPKTWATMAAAANRNTTPASSQAPAPTTSAPAPKTSPVPTTQVETTLAPTNQDDQPATPQSSGSEWQTAARDHGKKQTRPQAGATAPAENSRAYMKNVGENLTTDMIRNHLSKFGELTYCDINRQKNCAFADFAAPAGYQAAVGANPHDIGGERIIVEERRVRPAFNQFNQRGGMGPRGRGNMDNRSGGPGRGNFQKDGGRGAFGNRGRGNGPRGRGVSQAA